MTNLVVTFATAFLLWSGTQAQVLTSFESSTTKFKGAERRDIRPLKAYFEFQEMPSPLDTVSVKFTLELVGPGRADSLVVKVFSGHNWVNQIVSDTVFYWSGPCKEGDKYSSVLRFVPFRSGPGEIIFAQDFPHRSLSHDVSTGFGVSFLSCIDENGELKYLGPPGHGNPEYCERVDVQFGRDGRVHLRSNPDLGYNLLEYLIDSGKPIHIGDPVVIEVHLKANVELLKGIEAQIIGLNSVVSDAKVPRMSGFRIGDRCVLEFAFTPKVVRGEHGFSILVQDLADSTKNQVILCRLLLDDHGGLRYMSDRELALPLSILPANARTSEEWENWSTITVRIGEK